MDSRLRGIDTMAYGQEQIGNLVKAELVIIGNEITQGFTVDTNSAFLGRELGALGCIVSRKATVATTRATSATRSRPRCAARTW
jgi:hypothetical protein